MILMFKISFVFCISRQHFQSIFSSGLWNSHFFFTSICVCNIELFAAFCWSNCSGITAAEAELMYINEVERLDGFGQETFPVKVC